MSEWISVKDKLPDNGRLIIACFHAKIPDQIVVRELSYYPAMKEWLDNDSNFVTNYQWEVSHWMEMPQPPIDDEHLVLMTAEESPQYDNGFKQGFISGLDQARKLLDIIRHKELNDKFDFKLAIEFIDNVFINHIKLCHKYD